MKVLFLLTIFFIKSHLQQSKTLTMCFTHCFQPFLDSLPMFLGVSYALRVGFGVGDSFTLISIYTLALSAVPER